LIGSLEPPSNSLSRIDKLKVHNLLTTNSDVNQIDEAPFYPIKDTKKEVVRIVEQKIELSTSSDPDTFK
jgi:hypothetical protein